MELKEQPIAPTLAHKLGDVPHVSGLLRRIAHFSGAGERVAEWLPKVAKKYAPEQEPWATLRNQLRPRRVPRTDPLPHWTRLVSHTGITREGPPRTDWLCRLD